MSLWGSGFPTVRDDIDPEDHRSDRFVSGLLDLHMYGSISDPAIGPYPPRVALAHAGSMESR